MSARQRILKKPDQAGRISIGKQYKDKLFEVKPQPNGDLILSPVVVLHEREQWLWNNPEAMASLDRGLEQAAAGQTRDLGTFAQYAADEEDEE